MRRAGRSAIGRVLVQWGIGNVALTSKQQLFILEYVKDFNATRAAVAAGYAERSARTLGHRALNDPEVAEEIRRLISDRVIGADEVLVRLSEQARAAHGAYIKEDGDVDIAKLVKDGKGYLIKKIKETRYGLEIEFYDAQTALIHIDNRYRAAPADDNASEAAADWWAAVEGEQNHE